MEREEREQEFQNVIREQLNEKQFSEYLKDCVDVEEFCRKEIESFWNLTDEEQEDRLNLIKTYLEKK